MTRNKNTFCRIQSQFKDPVPLNSVYTSVLKAEDKNISAKQTTEQNKKTNLIGKKPLASQQRQAPEREVYSEQFDSERIVPFLSPNDHF